MVEPRFRTAVCCTCFRSFLFDPSLRRHAGLYCSLGCRQPRAFTGLERALIGSLALTSSNRDIALALGRRPNQAGHLSIGGFGDIAAKARRNAHLGWRRLPRRAA